MKKLAVLLVSVVMLAGVPGLVSAQGWLLPGLPSLPSFGGNGCGSCLGGVGGLSIAGDVAYVGYSRATTVEFTSSAAGVGTFNWRQGYPVHGIGLSATATAAPNDRLAVIARGTWLLPWNGDSFETYNVGVAGLERTWSTSTQWWTAEAAAAFSMNAWGAIVGGLRYDSMQTSFSSPSITFVGSLPGQEADLHVNLWIPYVGVVVNQGFVRFGLVAFPWVPGHLKYGQTNALAFVANGRVEGSGNTKNGYFLETWGEFNTNLMGATVGLFAKYTYVHVRVEDTLSTVAAVAPGISAPLEITFDRPNWIFGAQFALNFNSPVY